MLIAMITRPCTTAAQLQHVIAAWQAYKQTDEYQQIMHDPRKKTDEQTARKEEAHQARRHLRDAQRLERLPPAQKERLTPADKRKLQALAEHELQEIVDRADEAYGFGECTLPKGTSRNL